MKYRFFGLFSKQNNHISSTSEKIDDLENVVMSLEKRISKMGVKYKNMKHLNKHFRSSINHEFKSILINLQNAVIGIKAEVSDDKEEYLQAIDFSVNEMIYHFDNILLFSLLKCEQYKLNEHNCSAAEILLSVYTNLSLILAESEFNSKLRIGQKGDVSDEFFGSQEVISKLLFEIVIKIFTFCNPNTISIEASSAKNEYLFTIYDNSGEIGFENLLEIFDYFEPPNPEKIDFEINRSQIIILEFLKISNYRLTINTKGITSIVLQIPQ
jgi:light-regulated signal transduction histidine kinase (bacteriophytochrome)